MHLENQPLLRMTEQQNTARPMNSGVHQLKQSELFLTIKNEMAHAGQLRICDRNVIVRIVFRFCTNRFVRLRNNRGQTPHYYIAKAIRTSAAGYNSLRREQEGSVQKEGKKNSTQIIKHGKKKKKKKKKKKVLGVKKVNKKKNTSHTKNIGN
eukprot:TRINITY_DN3582_c0_g1_i1.p5 TRINITY_DN3582_c0_g1~~TRINITY_DN3582_c0_g1_i1.p5  ORF type:complete len:152 (-),score=5.32 TRINITY_DN3582_c0_g1_i1:95-550(-)